MKRIPFSNPIRIAICTIAMSSNMSFADPVPTEVRGHWAFEEGSFDGGFGPGSPTVLDSSAFDNHGHRPSPQSRVQYVSDAHTGFYSLDFNNPADGGTENGAISILHDESLEPPTGMVETQLKLSELPEDRAFIMLKSTFQFHNSEPGPEPPVFYSPDVDCSAFPNGCADGRIVGRAAYMIEVLADGRVRAIIANDGITPTDGNGGGPWTQAQSENSVTTGDWNHIAMSWDGCELAVSVNGVWSNGVSYEPIPEAGLSYRGTGDDPTLGPQQLPLVLSAANVVGQLDDVKVSEIESCPEFADAEKPLLPAIVPIVAQMAESGPPQELTPLLLGKFARKKVNTKQASRFTDDRVGEFSIVPGPDCGPLGCVDLLNGEAGDFLRTPQPTTTPFVLRGMDGNEIMGSNDPQIAASDAYLVVTLNGLVLFYSKDGTLLTQIGLKEFFKPLWDKSNPNNINTFLNLPPSTPCNPFSTDVTAKTFCLDAYYDARVIYDSYHDRFWLTALARNEKSRDANVDVTPVPHTIEEEYAARRSKLLVGVSRTQDPRDGWTLWWWDGVVDDGACSDPAAVECPGSFYLPGDSADYPSIGISEKYAVVTNIVARRNPVTADVEGRYHLFNVLEVSGLINGSAPTLWQLVMANPFDNSELYRATTQPAVHHGISLHDMAHLAAISDQNFLIWGLKPPSIPGTPPSVHYVKVPLTEQYLDIQEKPQRNFPGALQSQPIRVRNLGRSAMKASYRDFRLHVIFQDCRSWDPGQLPCSTSLHLVRANVFNFQHGIVPKSSSSGYIERVFGARNKFDDGGVGIYYYANPAIDVNKFNDIVAVYSRSGALIYPEARYSAYLHNESDIRPSSLLRKGLFPFGVEFDPSNPDHLGSDGVSPRAVGNLDTGGITVDPFDDTAIWMVHAFADEVEPKSKSSQPRGNWKWVVGKVFGETHPDLIVTSPRYQTSVHAQIGPGDALALEGVVINQGDAPAGSSRLRIVMSLDQTISGSDHQLSDMLIPGITSSGAFGFTVNATVPHGIAAGNYYILAHIDWTDSVFEYSNDNNIANGTPLFIEGPAGQGL